MITVSNSLTSLNPPSQSTEQKSNAGQPKTASVTRELDYLEYFFCSHDTIVVSTAVIETEKPISLSILQKVSYFVSKRHPLLHSSIIKSEQEGKLYWLKDEGLASQVCVQEFQIEEADEWMSLSQQLVNNFKFSFQGPLFRLILLNCKKSAHEQMIMLVVDHRVADGTSCMRIMNDILQFSACFISNQPFEAISLPMLGKPKELLLPPEKITAQEHEYIQKSIQEDFEKGKVIDIKIPFDYNVKGKKIEKFSNGLIFKKGSKENFANLKKFCKKHNITVGSVVSAAMFFSAAKLVNEKEKTKQGCDLSINLDLDVDINIRKRTEPAISDDHVGCLISAINVDSTVEHSTKFVDLCRNLKDKLDHKLNVDKEAHYRSYILEGTIRMEETEEGYDKIMESLLNRYGDMELSNIGLYPHPKSHGPLKLKELFTTSTYTPEGWVFSLLVNTIDYMCYCLVYEESLTKHETAEHFIHLVYKLVENCNSLHESYCFEDFVAEHNLKSH